MQSWKAGRILPPSSLNARGQRLEERAGRDLIELIAPLLYPPQQQLNPEQSGPEESKLQLLPREFTSALNNNNKTHLGSVGVLF